jgi:hypothetical protein
MWQSVIIVGGWQSAVVVRSMLLPKTDDGHDHWIYFFG